MNIRGTIAIPHRPIWAAILDRNSCRISHVIHLQNDPSIVKENRNGKGKSSTRSPYEAGVFGCEIESGNHRHDIVDIRHIFWFWIFHITHHYDARVAWMDWLLRWFGWNIGSSFS